MALFLLAFLYGQYLVTVVPTSIALALATRRRPRQAWNGSDTATLLFPYVVWFTLLMVLRPDKSMEGVFEPFWLGLVVSTMQVGALVRTWRRDADRAWPAFCVLVLGCLAALVIWAFAPGFSK